MKDKALRLTSKRELVNNRAERAFKFNETLGHISASEEHAYPQKEVQHTWRRLVRAGLVAGARRYGRYRGVLTWVGYEYHANEGWDF